MNAAPSSTIQGILLDIEGTTSSVSFVYDVMFPFVRRELSGYLDLHWHEPALIAACDQIAKDAGFCDAADWLATLPATADESSRVAAARDLVRAEVLRLMDGDIKATGLKQLQGLIWEAGFHGGELRAHVYDDVPPALQKWNSKGIDVRIYSSGSVQAQKLFFAHTIHGNLLSYFRGHYDTKIGGKKEFASYQRIADEFHLDAKQILFVSDVVAELDAARQAGMQAILSVRPGNAFVEDSCGHPSIRSFSEILEADFIA